MTNIRKGDKIIIKNNLYDISREQFWSTKMLQYIGKILTVIDAVNSDTWGKRYYVKETLYFFPQKCVEKYDEKYDKLKKERQSKNKDIDPYGEEDWTNEKSTYEKKDKELEVGKFYIYKPLENKKNINPFIAIRGYDGELVRLEEISKIMKNHPYIIKILRDNETLAVIRDCLHPYTPKIRISEEDPYGEEDWTNESVTHESTRKINDYIDELFQREITEKDENTRILIKLIRSIYKDHKIHIFDFPYLEFVDQFIRKENKDLIEHLVHKINLELPDCHIIMSGSFGEWIYDLIERNMVRFDNNVVVVNGEIRKVSEDRYNEVRIIKKRFKDIKGKFVFLDDSYFSGGTRDRINDFLSKFGSYIEKTYVVYTHRKEDPEIVYSLYTYSENHDEEVIPIHNYLKFIQENNIYLKDIEKELSLKIESDHIEGVKDLMKTIRDLSKVKENKLYNFIEFKNKRR